MLSKQEAAVIIAEQRIAEAIKELYKATGRIVSGVVVDHYGGSNFCIDIQILKRERASKSR